jgi:hypothetical protein
VFCNIEFRDLGFCNGMSNVWQQIFTLRNTTKRCYSYQLCIS